MVAYIRADPPPARHCVERTEHQVLPIANTLVEEPTDGILVLHHAAQVLVVPGEEHGEISGLLGGHQDEARGSGKAC